MQPHTETRTARGIAWVIGAALGVASLGVLAHGGAGSDKKMHESAAEPRTQVNYAAAEEHPFGKASDPANAARTIEVGMTDTLRFEPAVIRVKRGEPVRFVVHNQGALVHEMVLGTEESLAEHAALMKKFPGMEHAEPYMAHIAPGQHGDMGWTFTRAGEYFYGCLVPGHFDGGMVGRIVVE